MSSILQEGDILDGNAQPIVVTQGEPGSYQRFISTRLFSPVTGYDNARTVNRDWNPV